LLAANIYVPTAANVVEGVLAIKLSIVVFSAAVNKWTAVKLVVV
jgi:hypothetical protein